MSLFALCPLTRTRGIDEIPFWARLKIYLSAANIETWKGQLRAAIALNVVQMPSSLRDMA